MTLKRIILTAVAGIFLAGTTTFILANTHDPEARFNKRIEHRIERMKKKLNLTDAQVSQAKAIIDEAKPQMKANFKAMKDAPKDQKEALRAQLKKDRDATKEKLLAILTPEQRSKAEAMIKKHEAKWHEHEEKNEK